MLLSSPPGWRIVGQDAATELAIAADADPPHSASWQRMADG
jgi:hypothetical protein